MTNDFIRARLRELEAEARKIVEAADKDNEGVMTEEQQQKFDAAIAEIEKLKAESDRREKLGKVSGELKESAGRQTVPAQFKTERDKELEATCGFENMADFARAVQQASKQGGNAYVDPRLAEMPKILGAPTNFHREGGASEGYMVPPQMRDAIWELVFTDESLFGMADVENTSSNSVEFNADETTPWGATGVSASWRAEGSQMTPSRLVTNQRQVKLHELYAFVTATDELLEDAPRLGDRLTRKAAAAINYKLDDAIIYGTGAGQPLGFFQSGALVTVDAESGQLADTLNMQNVANMYSRLLPSSLKNAIWLMNSDALPQLITMTIPGNGALAWTPPASGAVGSPGGTLMGRPIRFSEHSKTLGDKGDIMLIDMKGYYALRRQSGVQFAESIHLYFDYGIQAFRWTFRAGGQPYLSAPVSPDNGSATKSHFVALAAR